MSREAQVLSLDPGSLGDYRPENRILAALPDDDYRRVRAHLRPFRLVPGTVLQTHDDDIRYVYFVERGLCAISVATEGGGPTEVTVVGKEGIVGLAALVGDSRSPADEIVSLTGVGFRMAIDAFHHERDRLGAFCELSKRYLWVIQRAIMRSAACHALHSVEERLARRLLVSRDGIQSTELETSQESLAAALAVRRPTVSVIMGAFRSAGLIENRHGKIRIVRSQELKQIACDCYQKIKADWLRLFPETTSSTMNRTA